MTDPTSVVTSYRQTGDRANATAVAAGAMHTPVLLGDGTIRAWGSNDCGHCDVPAGLERVRGVAAGFYHTVALLEDGTVRAWGNNGWGQCNVPAELAAPTRLSFARKQGKHVGGE